MTAHPGRGIVRAAIAGTAVFVVAGALSAAIDGARTMIVAVSLALFAAGVLAFGWSFFVAAARSRRDEIGVANLYLLTGRTAPTPVKRALLGALAVQVVACLVFGYLGFAGLAVDEVNPMAFGILVPTFGLGLNGLWAARHGRFGPRIVGAETVPDARPPNRPMPTATNDLEKNASHD